jgi:diguanylate cyclase (GGDEF)-like protein
MWGSASKRAKTFLASLQNSLTLRQQLGLATIILCVFLVAALAAGASYVARRQAAESVGGEMGELARTIADRLDRGMSSRFQDAILLSELDPLRNVWADDDAGDLRQVLEQLKRKVGNAVWIGFATPNGIVKAATGMKSEGTSVIGQSWFRSGRSGVIAIDVHESRFTSGGRAQQIVEVAAPVRDPSGELVGVLGVTISWNWAAELLKSSLSALNPERETDVSIFRWDGAVLLGANKASLPEDRLREILRQGAGYYTDKDGAAPALAGFAVTRGYGDFPGLGWIVVARQPTAIAFGPGNRLVISILAIGLVVAAIGGAIASVISKRVSKPIQTLAYEADRIGRDAGYAMLPHVRGSVEITQLSNALRSLLRRLDLSEQEKVAVEEKSAAESHRLSQDIDALRELADTDPLTGLLNRRAYAAIGVDVMSTLERNQTPFAVLVMDIDRFKRINDTHGHAGGDEVIRHVANLVKSSVRPSDHVARFGGEEFVALLRDCSLDVAADVAERARHTVEKSRIIYGRSVINCTVSIGVAVVDGGDRDLQDVIARADGALYVAKSSGRNRVEISARSPSSIQEAA